MTDIKAKVLVNSASVVQGSPLELIVEDFTPAANVFAAWWISKVDADRTEFIMASGNPFTTVDSRQAVICESTKQLSPGLYRLAKFGLQDTTSAGPSEPQIIPLGDTPILFKIVPTSEEIHTADEVSMEYKAILTKRDADFQRGLGYEPTSPGAQDYMVLVFVKDCLLTSRMRLGQYEVIPVDGLGFTDQIQLIQSVLVASQLPTLANLEETLQRAQQGQPTFVVHFPHVFAPSVEAAGQLVEDEVQRLIDVLAVHRNGYGAMFGLVLIDTSINQSWFRLVLPHYRGNMIGGMFSGEDARSIAGHIAKVRGDVRLQLYLSLFREALREEHPELAYFRLWNVLETIARSKGYPGQPLRDWAGNIINNRKGHPRQIQDDAKEMVFELIRELFTKRGLDENFIASGLQQGLISEQVPIWYRHRNCMVHSGGCFPGDPNHCLRTDTKYINCRAAHDEVLAQFGSRDRFTDQYQRALRETAEIAIISELS